MSVQKNAMCFVAVLASTLTLTLSAQESSQAGRESTQQRRVTSAEAAPQAGAQITPGSLDSVLASCLANGNQGQIAISRLAQERATNPEVKAFAEQMVKEHTAILSQLKSLGAMTSNRRSGASATDASQGRSELEGRAIDQADRPISQESRTLGQADNARDQGSAPTTNQPRATGQRQSGQATVEQLQQIQDQVAQACLERATRELSELNGAEFDKAYMGMQVGGHHKMAVELTVFESHVSPNLQAVISKGLRTTEQHLEQAKNLCKQLDSQGEPRTARSGTRVQE